MSLLEFSTLALDGLFISAVLANALPPSVMNIYIKAPMYCYLQQAINRVT